jgi:hypothetical protein
MDYIQSKNDCFTTFVHLFREYRLIDLCEAVSVVFGGLCVCMGLSVCRVFQLTDLQFTIAISSGEERAVLCLLPPFHRIWLPPTCRHGVVIPRTAAAPRRIHNSGRRTVLCMSLLHSAIGRSRRPNQAAIAWLPPL